MVTSLNNPQVCLPICKKWTAANTHVPRSKSRESDKVNLTIDNNWLSSTQINEGDKWKTPLVLLQVRNNWLPLLEYLRGGKIENSLKWKPQAEEDVLTLICCGRSHIFRCLFSERYCWFAIWLSPLSSLFGLFGSCFFGSLRNVGLGLSASAKLIDFICFVICQPLPRFFAWIFEIT